MSGEQITTPLIPAPDSPGTTLAMRALAMVVTALVMYFTSALLVAWLGWPWGHVIAAGWAALSAMLWWLLGRCGSAWGYVVAMAWVVSNVALWWLLLGPDAVPVA